MQKITSNKPSVYSFALFVIGFLLFLEWLRPLQQISDTGAMNLLLLFTVLVFVLSYLQTPAWFTFPLVLFAMLFVLHAAHFTVSLFDSTWVRALFVEVGHMFVFLFTRRWDLISDVARTFLLLILLCLIGYLMKYWLLQLRNAFLFLFVTVVYVAIIDTFTAYDASVAIIRIVVFGFILMGMLEIAKVQEKEGFGPHFTFPVQWVFFVVVMIFSVSLLGFLAPKAAPQWPDPVPFIKSTASLGADEEQGSKVQKIGYGSNDSQLGGAFQMDDTPVFTVNSAESQYWRAETKDVYTGKGWVATEGEIQPFDRAEMMMYGDNVELEQESAVIRMSGKEDFPFLFFTGQLRKIETPVQGVEFKKNQMTGKITTLSKDEEISLSEYTLTYDNPTFAIDHLKESGNNYPLDIREHYLQLPGTLPERVKELAEEITADKTTIYEKVKAIESYFSRNGFTYDTENVAIPNNNEDYVDQFLFVSKQGYCDNFSTSMIVMLRSIGIPARWVKGFREGDFQKTLEDGTKRYLVTNEHAHSWVEVYFPGSGWVPFEPTKGFLSPSQFVNQFENETDIEQNKDEQAEQEEEKEQEQVAQDQEKTGEFALSFGWKKWAMAFMIIVIMALMLLLIKNYKRLATRWIMVRFRDKVDDSAFDEAYAKLLWLLHMHGYKREPQQTLREYAIEVDHAFHGNEMKTLTKVYEERLYHHQERQVNWDQLKRLWNNVIDKMKS